MCVAVFWMTALREQVKASLGDGMKENADTTSSHRNTCRASCGEVGGSSWSFYFVEKGLLLIWPQEGCLLATLCSSCWLWKLPLSCHLLHFLFVFQSE